MELELIKYIAVKNKQGCRLGLLSGDSSDDDKVCNTSLPVHAETRHTETRAELGSSDPGSLVSRKSEP